jgi:hypothetical protein
MGIQHARLGAERLWKENQPLGYQALGPTVKRWRSCTISGPIARENLLRFHVQRFGQLGPVVRV